jgi:4-hydroxybenzoate polyprenyltransferase
METSKMTKVPYVQFFVASRPISWINTAYPFVAALILTQRTITPILIIGTMYFLIPYNFMLYGVNDVFDYESDIRNPRKGGVEGAQLAKSSHRSLLVSVTLLNVPFIVALVALGNLLSAVILGVLLFFVLAYSLPMLRFKERPVIDSITSSIHFVGPLIYGLSLERIHSVDLVIISAFFLWGMASHAFGAVQDIIADRKGRIASIATVFGARKTVWFSLILYIASATLLTSLGWAGTICALVVLAYAINIFPYRQLGDKQAELANQGWKHFISLNWLAGFIITMVLIYVYRH